MGVCYLSLRPFDLRSQGSRRRSDPALHWSNGNISLKMFIVILNADCVLDATVFMTVTSVDAGKCSGEYVDVLRKICDDTERVDIYASVVK